MEQNKSHVKTI